MSPVDMSVRRFIRETGAPLKKMAEALGLTSLEIMSWISLRGPRLRNRQFQNLAKFVGLSIDEIISQKYDVALVRKRLVGGPLSLPDRYGKNAFSYVRTSAHIVDFLALYFGRAACDRLLLRMGVHPVYFDNLDNKISLLFLSDLLNEVKDLGFSKEKVDELGHLASFHLRETNFAQFFEGADSSEEFWNRLLAVTDKLDVNFDYGGTICRDSFLLEVRPSEQLQMAMGSHCRDERLRSIDFLSYRKSLLESYPMMIDLEVPHVEILSSIRAGHDADRYLISFSEKQRSNLYLIKPPMACESPQFLL